MELYKSDTTKYDIPLSHLDYSYIDKCSDVKELEKIVKILRSGHEGKYPDLEEAAMNKLQNIHPNSKVLRVDKPAESTKNLKKTEKEELSEDLEQWESAMREKDKDGPVEDGEQVLPPVRGTGNSIPLDKKTSDMQSKKRPLPRDHREWDKVDIDAELAKVDSEKPELPSLPNDPAIMEHISVSGLTDEEKMRKSEQEKDKGNEAFKAGDYNEAITYYNRSLSIRPSVAAHNNRAQAYLKQKKWDAACKDCNIVLKMEPNNLKARLRRAVGLQGKTDFVTAKEDLLHVLQQEPNNKRASEVLKEIEQELAVQKVKGRRLVIEEVEGSDEEEISPEIPPSSLTNGHPSPSEIIHETKPTSSNKQSPPKKVSTQNTPTNKPSKESNSNDKDIWTADDLKTDAAKSAAKSATKSAAESAATSASTTTNSTPPDASPAQKEPSPTTESNQSVPEKLKQDSVEKTAKVPENFPVSSEDGSETVAPPVEASSTTVALPVESVFRPPSPPPELPPKVASLKHQGNQLFKAGQYGQAIGLYDQAIKLLKKQGPSQDPNLSLIYTNRATCRHKVGDCSGCVADCDEALTLTPGSLKPLLRRALAYEALEKYRGAYVDYRQVLYIDSSVELARQGSTRCGAHLNEIDGPDWRQQLPNIPIIAPSLATLQANAMSQRPAEKPTIDVPPDAPAISKPQPSSDGATLNKPANKPPPSPEQLFEKHKTEGNALVKKGDYKSAIACYSQCIHCCPGLAVAYTNRALCYLKTNQFENAINDCQMALSLEPLNIKAYFRQGIAYKEMKKYGESADVFKQLLKLDPQNTTAKKEFGQLLRLKHEHEKTKQTKNPEKPRQRVKIQEVDSSSEEEADRAARHEPSKKTPAPKQTGHAAKVKTKDSAEGKSTKEKKSTPSKSKSKSSGRVPQPNDPVECSPTKAPVLQHSTPFEFMHSWASLRGSKDLVLYANLLEQVAPKDIKKVLSNKIEGDMLMTMIHCAGHWIEQGCPEKALPYLQALPTVSRFEMVVLFLSDAEKREIKGILDKLQMSLVTKLTKDEMEKLFLHYAIQ